MKDFILAYEYESAMGYPIRKAVVCKTYSEYKRVKRKIENTDGMTLIEFDYVFSSRQIPE